MEVFAGVLASLFGISYILLLDITYFLITALMQIICYIPHLTFRMEWGDGIVNSDAFTSFAIEIPEGMTNENVLWMFGISLGLCCLLGVVFALICLVCNMVGMHGGMGVVICACLVGVWQFTVSNGLDFLFFSPVGVLQSYSGDTQITVAAAFAYYIFIGCALVGIGVFRVERYDFKIKNVNV